MQLVWGKMITGSGSYEICRILDCKLMLHCFVSLHGQPNISHFHPETHPNPEADLHNHCHMAHAIKNPVQDSSADLRVGSITISQPSKKDLSTTLISVPV